MRPSARVFNVYDGSLRHSSFESITTHGDGSVGVQVSKALPVLPVIEGTVIEVRVERLPDGRSPHRAM